VTAHHPTHPRLPTNLVGACADPRSAGRGSGHIAGQPRQQRVPSQHLKPRLQVLHAVDGCVAEAAREHGEVLARHRLTASQQCAAHKHARRAVLAALEAVPRHVPPLHDARHDGARRCAGGGRQGRRGGSRGQRWRGDVDGGGGGSVGGARVRQHLKLSHLNRWGEGER